MMLVDINFVVYNPLHSDSPGLISYVMSWQRRKCITFMNNVGHILMDDTLLLVTLYSIYLCLFINIVWIDLDTFTTSTCIIDMVKHKTSRFCLNRDFFHSITSQCIFLVV